MNDHRISRAYDVAALGSLVILRAPAGEIVHFTPEVAIDIAHRLLECAADASPRGTRSGAREPVSEG